MRRSNKATHGSGVSSSSQHIVQQEEESSDAIQKVIHPLKPKYMYTFRRVDHRHPRRPTDFIRKENHAKIQRMDDSYVWAPDLHDHHFYNNFQADWYIKVNKDRKLSITPHIYVDWVAMLENRNPVFNKVIAKAQQLGIYDMLGMWKDWNYELVAQFCSTACLSGNGYDSTINFSIEGHRFSLCIKEIPALFGLANDDFHRANIANERNVLDNELAPLYFLGNESNYGTIHGLLPEYVIFNKIFRDTLMPKRGDRSHINGSTRVFLLAILDDRPPPCINVFFWTDMLYMLKHGSSYVNYAPFIQKIINSKMDMEF
jgi:hypothetical protein